MSTTMNESDSVRKALLDLIEHFDQMGEGADMADVWAWEWHAAEEVRDWMDEEFPEVHPRQPRPTSATLRPPAKGGP